MSIAYIHGRFSWLEHTYSLCNTVWKPLFSEREYSPGKSAPFKQQRVKSGRDAELFGLLYLFSVSGKAILRVT